MSSSEPFLLDPANRAFLGDKPQRGRAVFKARLGLFLLAGILTLCLLITGWAGLEWGRWLMLQGDSTLVSAEVVSRRKDDRGDGGPEHYVTYRFEATTPTGPLVYQREQNVSKSTYARLHRGQTVSVRYNNAFPAISSIANDTNRRDGISVGALMWLPVALYMGWQMKRCRRDIRMSKQGQVFQGRVVRCVGTTDSEGNFQVELHYRFTAPGGHVIRDRDTGCRDDLKDGPLPAPDTPVAVLYLDEKNYKLL